MFLKLICCMRFQLKQLEMHHKTSESCCTSCTTNITNIPNQLFVQMARSSMYPTEKLESINFNTRKNSLSHHHVSKPSISTDEQ